MRVRFPHQARVAIVATLSASRQYEGVKMYLEVTDIIGVTIALTASVILIVSTILRNVQLTTQRDYWHDQYSELKLVTDPSIWE